MRYFLHATAIATTVLFGLSGGTPVEAADTLLIRQGRQLAETFCIPCHVIGTSDQASALSDALPFPTLAEPPDFDEGDLAVALYRPHPAMPTFDIGREDIDALTAYIGSLGSAR
ncbi:unnamed protein product [marine sediment metagenome]|uniref:Cytochrome c domain-containing protein n=1 Tax=marine sediment metagenome TaxID=412755 RepID=X0SE04_9ZZZZ